MAGRPRRPRTDARGPRHARRPWRRALLACAVTGGVLFGALVAFFLSTGCWSSRRPFLQAVDDFIFALGTFAREELGRDPAPFTDERYDEVIFHLDSDADGSVRGVARWHLERWGEAASSRLVAELYETTDRVRKRAAIEILGRLRVRAALPEIVEVLRSTMSPLDREKALDALDSFADPQLAAPLIECAERLGPEHDDHPRVLLSIARTGAGADYLLELTKSSDRTTTPPGLPGEPLDGLLAALVETGDRRALELVGAHLDHRLFWVRRGAAFALARSAAAAPIVLAALEAARDDFQRELLVASGLAGDAMARSRDVARRLAEIVDDPVIGPAAVRALAEHDTPWSIAALWGCQSREEPHAVVDALDAAPRHGPVLLERFLRHADPRVRTRAAIALSELSEPTGVALLARTASRDPDPRLRRYAGRLLQTQDKFRLHASTLRYFEKPARRWTGWSPPLHELPGALRSLHFASCVCSFLLAVALVAGWVKPLEPDRHRLCVVSLLAGGLLGDVVLLDDSVIAYRLAIGVHTLLLAGYVLQDRAFVRRRYERLAGASVWVLVPIVLYFGVPVIADALRGAAHEFSYLAALVVTFALALLAAVPVLAPWLHVPAWLRRGLVSGLLGAALVLVVLALVFFASVSWRRGEEASAVVAALLVVPPLLKLLGVLSDPRTSRRGRTPPVPPASPGRLRVVDIGPTTTLRLPAPRLWIALVVGLLGVAVLGWTSYSVGFDALGGRGAGELSALYAAGAIGALLLTVSWLAVACRHVVQIRDGLVRHGVVVAGAVFSRVRWRRCPPPDLRLSSVEVDFVRSLLLSSRSSAAQSSRARQGVLA